MAIGRELLIGCAGGADDGMAHFHRFELVVFITNNRIPFGEQLLKLPVAHIDKHGDAVLRKTFDGVFALDDAIRGGVPDGHVHAKGEIGTVFFCCEVETQLLASFAVDLRL